MLSKQIEDFLAYLRDTESKYHMAQATEEEKFAETNDLLHRLELQEHSYHEYAKLAKEIAEVRKERRDAKDFISMSDPIIYWIDANKTCIKSLEQLLGDVRKAERATENRIYTPRAKGVMKK